MHVESGALMKKKRLFGEEFFAAEARVFKRLPKKYHAEVHDLVTKMQLWNLSVFFNIQREWLKENNATNR
jgi:hypothetical protein